MVPASIHALQSSTSAAILSESLDIPLILVALSLVSAIFAKQEQLVGKSIFPRYRYWRWEKNYRVQMKPNGKWMAAEICQYGEGGLLFSIERYVSGNRSRQSESGKF